MSYSGPRCAHKRVNNDYVSLRLVNSFNPPGTSGGLPYALVASNAGMNNIQGFEVAFTPRPLIGSGTLAASLYSAFDEFRVRSVHVRIVPNSALGSMTVLNNATRTYAGIYWVPDHQTFETDDGKIPFTDYPHLLESGRCSVRSLTTDKQWSFTYVPQAVKYTQYSYANPAFEVDCTDVPQPWLQTNDAHLDDLIRGPYVFFRRPYSNVTPEPVVQNYDIIVEVVFEFRNLNKTA